MVVIASPTLIIGATGFIGRFVTEASLSSGRTTYVLVRSPASKPKALRALEEMGAIVLHGSICEREFMEKILRDLRIEAVISAVGGGKILDQLTLIEAIKAVGTVKIFVPSEFGHEVDREDPVEPGLAMYNMKREVRRAIEAAGIPYTYICCNSIAGWPYHNDIHPAEALPPMERFYIYGDGSVKAYFVAGTDIGKFTIKVLDDARTVNKSVHFRPVSNHFSINELADLWEKKIGRTLPRITLTEEDLLSEAEENRIPESIVAALTHDIFIRGCQNNSSGDGPNDVEITALYPDAQFRSLDECFDEYLVKIQNKVNDKISQLTAISETIPIPTVCA